MHFLEWKYINFTDFWSYWTNQQYPIIGLDDDLAPARLQAIIRTNDG